MMKRLLLLCLFALLVPMTANGMVLRGSGGGGGGTCSSTPFFEQTTDSSYDALPTTFYLAQMVPNSTSRQICKVSVQFDNVNAGAVNVTMQIRTAHYGGGTLLGDEKIISIPTGMNWTDATWTSNYPTTSGNIYVNLLAATNNVWWGADTSTGATLHQNEFDYLSNMSLRIRLYALQ